jgi:hypothetical protein
MPPVPNIEEELERILHKAQHENIPLRLMGGLAFHLRCPSTNEIDGLKRPYPDLDFAIIKTKGKELPSFFDHLGYVSNKNFNILNGDRRQLYYDELNQRQIDIFVGSFEMCHRLPFANRLEIDAVTLPLAELLLTKAQIVQLNRKDILDMIALLLDHPLGHEDGEDINLSWITNLTGKDWGLYTTVNMTLDRVSELLNQEVLRLERQQLDLVTARIKQLKIAMNDSPKTNAWKLRSKIGKRKQWYLEVEEVQR